KKRREAMTVSDEEKKIEARTSPLRFWFFASVSALLTLTFIWVLPDRFLNHTAHGEMHEEMDEHIDEMMHGDEEHDAYQYHEESEVEEGVVVNLVIDQGHLYVGSTTLFGFHVRQLPGELGLVPLEIEHEKYMHVIAVRNDLEEFFHIHPNPVEGDPMFLSIEYNFSRPGTYKIWSEIKKDGVVHVFGHEPITIEGEGERSKKDVFFARSRIVDDYQITLDYAEPLVKGRDADFVFDIHDLTGGEIEVEPYLGADMHLTIIKDDWKQFIHTHPEGREHHEALRIIPFAFAHGDEDTQATGEDRKIKFHVTLPEAGLYKAFAQFRPRGIQLHPDEAITTSFWIRVEEQAQGISGIQLNAGTQRIIASIISIIAIIALSYGVKAYLRKAEVSM
ncbi:MAG: hypothetical protein G01um101466_515, partial [Parcubacteria group bacterium Gr01-1014_66]